MILAFLYLMARRLVGMLLGVSAAATSRTRIAVSRHEISVLRRHVERPEFREHVPGGAQVQASRQSLLAS